MSRGTSAHAFSRRPPTPSASAEPHPPVTAEELALAVTGLEGVLLRVREAQTPEGWSEAKRGAHQLFVSAEQCGFSEVANAVLHVEDAVAAVADGELQPDSATFRQIDAALRSARAACEMPEAQDPPLEAPASRGLVWIVGRDEELRAELVKAVAKKQLDTL